MNRTWSFPRSIYLFLLCCLCICSSCGPATNEVKDSPRVAAGVKLQDVSFYSPSLGRQVTYRVFLPADVPAGRKLAVVYVLHGAGIVIPTGRIIPTFPNMR